MNRYSIVNNDYTSLELAKALATFSTKPVLERSLSTFLGRQCVLTSNGFTAMEMILRHLKTISPTKNHVILPAYTAPGLILPIRTLGLIPVLCDISMETFNYDINILRTLCNKSTLAILCVHTFGIPCDMDAIITSCDFSTLIEDCAQSLGSTYKGKQCGSIADYAIGSFARGKNLSFYGGGFLCATDDNTLANMSAILGALPQSTLSSDAANIARHLVFSALTSPSIYNLVSSRLNAMKPTVEKTAYLSARPSRSLSILSSGIFALWATKYARRIENGRMLYDGLSPIKGLRLPRLPENSRIAFNRLPILIENEHCLERIIFALNKRGVDGSRFYKAPIHFLHEVGYAPGSMPNAEYFAKHLLTLPTYGQLPKSTIDTTIETIKEVLNS